MMFNFESVPREDINNVAPNSPEHTGLEGLCSECHGRGHVSNSFLNPQKVCAECHGKGFVKKENPEEVKHYDWDTGTVH